VTALLAVTGFFMFLEKLTKLMLGNVSERCFPVKKRQKKGKHELPYKITSVGG